MPIILKLFRNFQDFIESSKKRHYQTIWQLPKCANLSILNPCTGAHNPISRHIYAELTEKIERMFRFFDILVVKVSFVGTMIPPLLNSVVNYYILDLGDESFLLPRPMMCVENYSAGNCFCQSKFKIEICLRSFRLPFNWRTPHGYLTAWFLQAIGLFCTVILVPGFNVLYFGSCWLFVSFVNDITNDLPQMNAIKSQRPNYNKRNSRFCRRVQDYSDLKQLSEIYCDSLVNFPTNILFWNSSVQKVSINLSLSSSFRFMTQFNVILEFLIFGLFGWTLLAIGSSLIAFFTLLVEYSSNTIHPQT